MKLGLKLNLMLGAVAALLAIAVRVLVFTDDCNLLVMLVTWLAIWTVLRSLWKLVVICRKA